MPSFWCETFGIYQKDFDLLLIWVNFPHEVSLGIEQVPKPSQIKLAEKIPTWTIVV
jgi:hypothetical protein